MPAGESSPCGCMRGPRVDRRPIARWDVVTMDDELISVREAARRLEIDPGGLSRQIARLGIPLLPGLRNHKRVSWPALLAALAARDVIPAGYVRLADLA